MAKQHNVLVQKDTDDYRGDKTKVKRILEPCNVHGIKKEGKVLVLRFGLFQVEVSFRIRTRDSKGLH